MGSEELGRRVAERLRAAGRRPVVIPVGGSNGVGSWGYVEALRELEAQAGGQPFTDIAMARPPVPSREHSPQRVSLISVSVLSSLHRGARVGQVCSRTAFRGAARRRRRSRGLQDRASGSADALTAPAACQACGSGGTAAGVALGVRLSGAATRVHAYGVCDDEAYFYDHIDHLYSMMGVPPDAIGGRPAGSSLLVFLAPHHLMLHAHSSAHLTSREPGWFMKPIVCHALTSQTLALSSMRGVQNCATTAPCQNMSASETAMQSRVLLSHDTIRCSCCTVSLVLRIA